MDSFYKAVLSPPVADRCRNNRTLRLSSPLLTQYASIVTTNNVIIRLIITINNNDYDLWCTL